MNFSGLARWPQPKIFIGSSNFTDAGFRRNIEWNYFSSGEINLPFEDLSTFEKALEVYDHYWKNTSVDVTGAFLFAYKKRFALAAEKHAAREAQDSELASDLFEARSSYTVLERNVVKPNSAQQEALTRLAHFRRFGITKAAIIAATGVGKTYLAAFDVLQSNSRNVLFIAHRENILNVSFRQACMKSACGVL